MRLGPALGGRASGVAQVILAAAIGALQSLAATHTGAWGLPLVGIAWLVWRLDAAAVRPAAFLGAAFGTGWLLAAVWWLFISMHRYGGLPAGLAALAVLALAAALSLYLAAACAAYARWRTGRAGPDAALFAALWALAEWARGVLFTGFPWAASGYTQLDAPLSLLAPWVGVYGMGAALAGLAALLASALRPGRQRWQGAGLALTALALLAVARFAGPPAFTQPAGRISVTLIQTNVAQDDKFAAERMPEALAWLGQALQGARGDLVVAPETAVPLLPSQLSDFAPGWWEDVSARFSESRQSAIVGLPLGSFEAGYTNSVAGLSAATGGGYRYDKVHLVPFGEFIPTGFRWFTELMRIPLGDFARGPLNAPSFSAAGQRVAPNICFEDLFGEELAVRFTDPALAPTLLANLSNIGWFGDTIAVPQHLNISRLRTLELQRPMLRATNTGATAVIDHQGRVTRQLPAFTRGTLEGEVEGRTGVTPYAWWAGRFGLWPLFVLALAVVAACAAGRTRGSGGGPGGSVGSVGSPP